MRTALTPIRHTHVDHQLRPFMQQKEERAQQYKHNIHTVPLSFSREHSKKDKVTHSERQVHSATPT